MIEPTEKRPGRDPEFNEVVGGGFFVFQRNPRTYRVSPNRQPYEHPTRESAEAERDRLSAKYPGVAFQIFEGDPVVART